MCLLNDQYVHVQKLVKMSCLNTQGYVFILEIKNVMKCQINNKVQMTSYPFVQPLAELVVFVQRDYRS